MAVYAQTWRFQFLNYDDEEYVSRNLHLRDGLTQASAAWAFRSTEAAYWFPVTRFSYLLDAELHGIDPAWFHLTNALLHAACVLLLFLCLRRMTGALWRSAFVAFAFALHPTHVETVAWIAERKELLSALFWFLTLWTYLVYAARPRVWSYLAMIALFCGGLMSQALIVTLPFAMLLLDFWPLDRFGRLGARRLVVEKIPLIALAGGASLITLAAQRSGGALASLEQIPAGLRIENALASYVIYLGQFFWPAKLAVIYPYREIPWWQAGAAAAILAAITILAIREVRRRPYFLVGWAWFLLTLAPVIGIFQAGPQPHADRYTYIPFIGLAMIAAWGFGKQRYLPIAAAMVCGAWFTMTWLDLGYWQNSSALFQRAAAVTSDNWIAQNTLGDALRREGKMDDAISHLNEALRLEPARVEVRINLGVALAQRGDRQGAGKQYRAALRLDPENADAQEGLGVVLLETGQIAEAAGHLENSVKTRPGDAGAHFQLGRCYGMEGRSEDAAGQFSEAVRIDPDDAQAHFNLGTAWGALGRFAQACEEFRTALRLNPGDANAHLNLGAALASMGRCDQAVGEFRGALRLQPELDAAKAGLEECGER